MIPQARKLYLTTVILILVLAPVIATAAGEVSVSENIVRIIDGDTMEISGGARVRLLGIDAPERGEPFSLEAADRVRELTASGIVKLKRCGTRDKYDRILATVTVGKYNINEILLLEGLAIPMLIPPCGRPVAQEVLNSAGKGALTGKGIYSLEQFKITPHLEAGTHIGERAVVQGKILALHKGRKAWHFNFGEDWKTDFTAVLFRNGQQRYLDLGLDPFDLVGLEVLVIGKLKRYNGPEIIVQGPEQILPLEGVMDENPKSKIQNGDSHK